MRRHLLSQEYQRQSETVQSSFLTFLRDNCWSRMLVALMPQLLTEGGWFIASQLDS